MKLVRGVLLVVVALLLLAAGGLAVVYFVVAAPTSTVGEVEFDRELEIPPLAESRVTGNGTRVFELEAQQGTAELLPGSTSSTWGFNGPYLGPTLRAGRGERLRVEVRNGLDRTTTLHWHGMHLPARFDGGPHQPIAPGGSRSPTWRVDQPASTLWYHPHLHGETQDHVNRGLAGMFILDDPRSEVADQLPHEYGVDDIPVIVQDKAVGEDGEIESDRLGEDLLLNGTYGPYLDVATQKVRLRLLNASVERVYSFGFPDDRELTLIGSDGGLLPAPVRLTRVRLSPGERAEVVVSVQPGERAVLRSYPPDLGANFLAERFNGGEDQFDVLQLRAADHLRPAPRIPERLAPAPHLDVQGAKVRRFELSGRQINGRSMDMSRIDQTIELGTTEVWEVSNTDGEHHNFHVHDVRFQVLSVSGREPPPELSGWKDTIYMPPGSTTRLAMRFTDHADPHTPYMYHCHLLRHEDNGMMGQFVVVDPPRTPRMTSHLPHRRSGGRGEAGSTFEPAPHAAAAP